MSVRHISLFIMLLLVRPSFGAAEKAICTSSDFAKADEFSGTTHDWDSLRQAFHKFKQCDDGGIAEGFDDNVMKLLATRWDTFPHLVAIASHDAGFKAFVLNHISATGNPDDIHVLKRNAERSCGRAAKLICKAIIARADTAIQESK